MTDETTTAPSAEGSEPMSFDSALDILNNSSPEETAEPEAAAAEPEVTEAEPAEAEAEPEADATPEADPEAPEFLHGNARTRLRDGSEVTIGELKKAYDEAKEYRVKQAEFDAKRQEFEAKQTQIAQQEQQSLQIVQQAKAVLQANFPPKPDYEALKRGDIDIITYQEQQAHWNAAAEKWQALSRAEQAATQKAEKERADAKAKKIADAEQAFLDKNPTLKTPEAQKAFVQEVRSLAEEYGITQEQVRDKFDEAWILQMAKDATAWRKLQSEKAAALAKAKDAPPVQVQAPGRRVSPAEQKSQAISERLSAARKSGGMSFNDALALMNQLDN